MAFKYLLGDQFHSPENYEGDMSRGRDDRKDPEVLRATDSIMNCIGSLRMTLMSKPQLYNLVQSRKMAFEYK